MPAIVIAIRGTPQPQPRPRFVAGRVISTASKPVKAWRQFVERAAHRAMLDHGWRFDGAPFFTGALEIEVVFTFAAHAGLPERIGKPHTHKPDSDNLAKSLLDALQAARLFKDDAQVATVAVRKLWGVDASTVVVVRQAALPIQKPNSVLPPWITAEYTSVTE